MQTVFRLLTVVLGLASLEILSAASMALYDGPGNGNSLAHGVRLRGDELMRAWRTQTTFGDFDPITQTRHLPGSMYAELSVNQHGFIGNGHDEDQLNAFPEKPEDLIRVILLGGSSTAGSGVTENGHTISAQLERLLNSEEVENTGLAGTRFQVLNFGIAGGYTALEFMKFWTEIVHYQPDIVITLDGFNDAWNTVFEYHRYGLENPIANWFGPSYGYFERNSGLRSNNEFSPRLMTFTSVAVSRLFWKLRGREERLGLYSTHPSFHYTGQLQLDFPYLENVNKANLMSFASSASAMNICFIAYLQPHALEGKSLNGEEQERLTTFFEEYEREFGSAFSEDKYRSSIIPAFGAYSQVYAELAQRAWGSPCILFSDIRDLFNDEEGTAYVDNIHYTALGNRLLARRYADDIHIIQAGISLLR